MENIKTRLKIVVPQDWNRKQKGNFFEKFIADLLKHEGYSTKEQVRLTGMEIDIIAKHPITEERMFVECKFEECKPLSSEVINCLLGKAYRENVNRVLLASTAELTSDSKGIVESYNTMPRNIDFEYWDSEIIADKLIHLKSLTLPNIHSLDINSVKVITLLVMPEQTVWVAEVIKNAEPSAAIIFKTCHKQLNIGKIKKYIEQERLWRGLKLIEGTYISKNAIFFNNKSEDIENNEFVFPIGTAEKFEVYQRPCNPKDFIGRSHVKKVFWEFLDDVMNGRTSTRIMCFSGKTGLGKSSLIVKLKDEAMTYKEYKKRFYFFDVDIRSAKGKLFVMAAVKQALNKAIKDGFVALPTHELFVESVEQPLFANPSFKKILEYLSKGRKIIVIFFDQFEEIFTKESLFFVYECFERLAYEINSLKANIVLGFSWRTGILMPDDHKARHLWDKLSDIREEIEIEEFWNIESRKFVKHFKSYLSEKNKNINSDVSAFLVDGSSGIPWVLKRLCSSIYVEQLNADSLFFDTQELLKRIFNKDLGELTSQEYSCLEYVAKSSPINLTELLNKFDNRIVKTLEESRFLIRTGVNYTIYWDIFREFIVDKKLPPIFIKYNPRVAFYECWKVISCFRNEGVLQNDCKRINFAILINSIEPRKSQKSLKNILLDLSYFFQFIRVRLETDNDFILAPNSLLCLDDLELANYLAKLLESHIGVQNLLKNTKPGQKITLWGVQECLKVTSPDNSKSLKSKTYQDYTSRIMSWLFFAGFLEKTNIKHEFLRPICQGKQKGSPQECQLKFNRKDWENIYQLELKFETDDP